MDVLRFTTALSGANSNSISTSATNLSQSSTPTASPAPARRGPGFMSMLFGSGPASAQAQPTTTSGIKRVAAPVQAPNTKDRGDDEGRRSPLRVASCEGPMMTQTSRVPTTTTSAAQRVHVPVMRKLW